MKPSEISKQLSLHSVPWKSFVDPLHEQVLLALLILWASLEEKFVRRRVIIEPVIGHCKHEHKLEGNDLKGELGDRINAQLSAAAWNAAKLMRWLAASPRAAARLLAAALRLLQLLIMRVAAALQNALQASGVLGAQAAAA